MSRRMRRGKAMLLALVLLLAVTAPVHAAKLLVESDGVDSPTCGSKASPCRSLSQAIDNASAGDKIEVGPGLYGDFDGDSLFNGSGEEAAEFTTGCDCMIDVAKRLTITSRSGAGATILDAGGAAIAVVALRADGVVFGKKKKGFTLRGALDDSGLVSDPATTGIVVSGNRAHDNGGDGFRLDGVGHRATDNRASENGGDGFELNGEGTLLKNNEAIANAFGIFVNEVVGAVLTGNVTSLSVNQGLLFAAASDAALVKGSAVYANREGVRVAGSNHTFEKTSFVGNLDFGVLTGLDSMDLLFSKSNFFGNGDGDFGCGLLNQSASAPVIRGSFWGAATGPGADPADFSCVNGAGVDPIFESFATKPIKVKVKIAQ